MGPSQGIPLAGISMPSMAGISRGEEQLLDDLEKREILLKYDLLGFN
jgi:hypothetical protein